ncbi:ATP-binding cassette domain-containing protein [Streptosporangium minutum]|uniref:ABC transporter domain-containing protein n=1 Tax=Streptosporangium minutum TaxID=569862 RepID=A0A243RD41_9ACTN|nr:hypothetical protein CA984_29360 [Streptosporangium minutum]
MPAQTTAPAVGESCNGRPVLDSVTCSLAGGERTGIVGENGPGESTLLRVLAGERASGSSGVRRRVLTSREARKNLPAGRSSLRHAAG